MGAKNSVAPEPILPLTEWSCVICHRIPDVAYTATCSHVYCKKCKPHTCVMCNAGDVNYNEFATRTINCTKLSCPVCSLEMFAKNMQTHACTSMRCKNPHCDASGYHDCAYEPTRCAYCENVFAKSSTHFAKCDYRFVNCDLCKQLIRELEMPMHRCIEPPQYK